MFTMMNNARLAVGVQGVAVAERATQRALAFARERRQGRAPGTPAGEMSPIIAHPDVRRMLLTMRAETDAARALCLMTADALDRARRLPDPAARAAAHAEASLLTPVAKAFSTDAGIKVSSIGIQVHGGMGYVEETGAAQHFRDARIFAIYEGTNGIQAIDLVTRKLPLGDGTVVDSLIADYREEAARISALNAPEFGETGARLREAVDALARATRKMLDWVGEEPTKALSGATPYLALFARAAGAPISPAPRAPPMPRWRKGRMIRASAPASPPPASSRKTSRWKPPASNWQRRRAKLWCWPARRCCSAPEPLPPAPTGNAEPGGAASFQMAGLPLKPLKAHMDRCAARQGGAGREVWYAPASRERRADARW